MKEPFIKGSLALGFVRFQFPTVLFTEMRKAEFGYTAEDWWISGIFAPFSREAQAHNYLWFIEPSAIASNSCEVHAGRKRIGCRRRTTLVGLVPPEGRPEGESRWDELKRQSSPAIHYKQGHRGLPYMTSEFKGGRGVMENQTKGRLRER